MAVLVKAADLRSFTAAGTTLGLTSQMGQGLILQPEAVVADALLSGALVPLLADWAAASRSMHLLFSPRRPQPAKLRAVIDFLVAKLSR